MSDPEIVTVPRELYYHEVAYVRGLEAQLATAMAKIDEMDRLLTAAYHDEAVAKAASRAQMEEMSLRAQLATTRKERDGERNIEPPPK